MRLIDADKIVNFRVTSSDGKKYVLLPVEKLCDIPTAYDVDKVIEELIDERWEDKCCGCKLLPPFCGKAINIVKRGGVDEGDK